MNIDKSKLLKAADIAKDKADKAKESADAPTLEGLSEKIDALEARITAQNRHPRG